MRETPSTLSSLLTIAAVQLEQLRGEGVRLITRRDLALAGLLVALGYALDLVLPSPAPGAVLSVINFWVQIAILIVSALISYALQPKPAQPPKPSLEDFDFPTAEEGRPIPVVFGEVWISGPNILWYGDLETTPIRIKGGK